MKLINIVTQLQNKLPLLTQEFTDTVAVSSINHVSGVATVTTATDHNLSVGESTNIIGAFTHVTIASITHAGADGIATVTTNTDHDYTLYSSYVEGNIAIIHNANEADFNGSFTILGVENRRVFTIAVNPGAPAAATGSPDAVNGSNVFNTIRGQYAVQTVTSPTVFTINHTANVSSLGPQEGDMSIRSNPRITGAVSDEAAVAAYSRNGASKTWMFVVIDDSVVSRGRSSRIDAVDVQTIGQQWQQYILQPFSLLVAIPASNQTLGQNARDTAEDLLRPILRSVCGAKFPTGLGVALAGPAQFVSHAFARYDGSVYWHDYQFEQRAEMTVIDTVEAGDDVAFRDVSLTLTPDLDADQGLGKMTDAIDLDDTPL